MMQILTLDRLREMLAYDPATGAWTWLKSPCRSVLAGDSAGYLQNGYRVITLDGKPYRASRLACFYVNGEFPAIFVDHENLARSDDRWFNLRDASRPQNGANRPVNRNNTSGFKGVSWDKNAQKWSAKIGVAGRRHHLGLFSSPEEARDAYLAAADKHFGPFARAA